MHGIKKLLATAVLSASFLFSGAAQAMPIPQFDKMTQDQKGDFTVFLLKGAYNILTAQGKTADAEKVIELFEVKDGKPAPPAIQQLVENLNAARKINQQNAADPTFKPFEVEHALSLTLKENGVIVPVSKLLLVGQEYKPSPQSGVPPLARKASPAPGSHQ